MDITKRQAIEREIATQVVKDALANGFEISVDNGGEDDEISRSTDESAVLAAMFLADDDHLYFYKPREEQAEGWVWFVYGNDAWDVIADYTVNLEKKLLTKANKLAEKFERQS